MSFEGYALAGLTALVAALVAVLVYALLRFAGAAGEARRAVGSPSGGSAVVVSAVQEAVSRLREEQRETHARAEASERLSDLIVSSMTAGLLLIDVPGRVRLVNPAGRRLLGLEVSAAGDYRQVLAHVPMFLEVLTEALRVGRPIVRRAMTVGGRDGLTHLDVTVSPVADSDGRLQSIVCVFNDVTAVMALEEELRLKDSLARVGELTAGVAHEFRNGLATIHGYARLVDTRQLPEPFGTYVDGIREEATAMGEVVTNFLNFARPVPLSLGTVDLRALLDRAADDVRPEVERRGGCLELSGSFPEIEGDEILLRQAFSNLCRNAAEACQTSSRPPFISLIGVPASGPCAHIVVTDNGPGIEPRVLARVFQPFVTTKRDGTGLGLALVQKIVVTHNGRIQASNRQEGGARFDVLLPLTHRLPLASRVDCESASSVGIPSGVAASAR
jgi:PAS domain S-box-containing protein